MACDLGRSTSTTVGLISLDEVPARATVFRVHHGSRAMDEASRRERH